MTSEELLKEISRKLDGISALLKISNQEKIEQFQKQISKDKVNVKIIQLSDGTKNYSVIAKQIAEELQVSEINVKKKISELVNNKIIMSVKSGKESYYQTTGLLD
ncbi:MAG: hypothetical protein IIC67_08850 [Thaumarchaeota archaeon]|nr:hypothetical protein [Nitrososphaerota archaeon]